MKCDFCDNPLGPDAVICNQCGAMRATDGKWYPNKFAVHMNEKIPLGSGDISINNFIRVILINITVLSILFNLIFYFGWNIHVIWLQYPISIVWIIYRILKSLTCTKSHVLQNLRVVFYWLVFSSFVTSIFIKNAQFLFCYAWPLVLVVLDILSVFLVLSKMSNGLSFVVTLILNSLIEFGALIYALFSYYVLEEPILFNVGTLPHVISLSLSLLLIINYVSLKFFVRKSIKPWER